jgi:UDP-hydrolysing UDP-N-acetyl-D-glucosamine 2-epimerase
VTRRIAVFTATRAEYGLLRPILLALRDAADLDLVLLVSGAHLAPSHGRTLSEIERDGLVAAEMLETLVDSDSPVGTAATMALTLDGVARSLRRLDPDLLVLLGDRSEALAAAAAAMVARVPIVHLHGGERTEGAIDEAIRHSITKMAHLHLVAAEPFRRRVIQLGEDPRRVHVVGGPGLDNVGQLELAGRQELAELLDWDPGPAYLVVTHHPATLDPGGAVVEVEKLVRALDELSGHRVLCTAPNTDPEGWQIRRRLEAHAAEHPERFRFVTSLGQRGYLSAVAHADVVVGNSSSGLIEAPFLGTPTVNIGARQRGRLRAPSVIDCEPDQGAILAAIRRALALQVAAGESPYGDGHTTPRVLRLLRDVPLDGLLDKHFHDLGSISADGLTTSET